MRSLARVETLGAALRFLRPPRSFRGLAALYAYATQDREASMQALVDARRRCLDLAAALRRHGACHDHRNLPRADRADVGH